MKLLRRWNVKEGEVFAFIPGCDKIVSVEGIEGYDGYDILIACDESNRQHD